MAALSPIPQSCYPPSPVQILNCLEVGFLISRHWNMMVMSGVEQRPTKEPTPCTIFFSPSPSSECFSPPPSSPPTPVPLKPTPNNDTASLVSLRDPGNLPPGATGPLYPPAAFPPFRFTLQIPALAAFTSAPAGSRMPHPPKVVYRIPRLVFGHLGSGIS